MSKTSAPRSVAANQAFATVRDVKGSHTKAFLVMDLIRGKKVDRALNDLTFSRKKLAGVTKQLLMSAVANAENNHQLNVDNLVIAHAYADKATILKRWNPRARGRAAPILKARCHLTIVVEEKAPEAKAKPAAKPAKAKAEAEPAAKKAAPKAEAAPAEAATTEKTEA